MKIFLNALLFWITISCYSYGDSDNESNSEKEEVDFYKSLQDSYHDDPKSVLRNNHRDKRARLDPSKGVVYESEVKVLGRVDGEAKERVERSSGNSDFSISEIPIEPTSTRRDPPSSEHSSDYSLTEVSTVDPITSKEVPKTTHDGKTLNSGSPDDSKAKDEGSDIGTGIEVESEEKLTEDEPSTSQSSPQSTETEIAVSSRSDIRKEVLWPSGTYGFPKPSSGCPESSGFKWSSGVRFYDTEDDGTENHNSLAFHLAGGVTEDGVTFEFCIKTKDVGVRSWPAGKYCVYKKGGVCPDGLKSGFVYWDDENRDNKNFFEGTLPEGIYTEKTKIYFCCSSSGNVESEIILPTEKPFYLFPHESTSCQTVKKMKSTLEFVKFDEEDKGDIEKSAEGFHPYGIRPREKDHTLYLCYYQPQGKDDLSQLSEGTAHSENVAHSEKIIHDFLKIKEPSDMDEVAKQQISRTRNGKKFQGMQTSTYHAIVIATGFVLTTVAILVGALLVISYFTKRWSKDIKRTRTPPPNNIPRERSKTQEHIKPQQHARIPRETLEQEREQTCDAMDFAETETEQEEEELVEDQFLPSDSQLKSGLEFLFLKQQKRKWLARKDRNK